MTPKMKAALEMAAKQEIRRVWDETPGLPPWPAPASTLAALVRNGYVERTERLSKAGHRIVGWRATDAGRMALKGPVRVAEERPRYLARPGKNRGDYTSDPRHRIDHLEVAGQASLKWRRIAEAERLDAKDRREVARELARQIRAA